MNDHTVTENIVQRGDHISGTINCSCGLEASIVHLRGSSLNVARARLKRLHNAPNKKESFEADLQEPRTVKDLAEEQRVADKAVKEHRRKPKKKNWKKTTEEMNKKLDDYDKSGRKNTEETPNEPEETWEDEGGAY